MKDIRPTSSPTFRSIGSKRDKSRPFLLMCQHKAPHREWEPPSATSITTATASIPNPRRSSTTTPAAARPSTTQDMTIAEHDEPQGPQADAAATTSLPRSVRRGTPITNRSTRPSGRPIRRARTLSAGSTTGTCTTISAASKPSIDEIVGRISEYLDDEGLAENTIVVYSSDQGFYLGEHGWFDKRWIFEESLRAAAARPLAGRRQGGHGQQPHRSPISTSPRPSLKRRACPSRPTCKAEPGPGSQRERRRPTGGRAFYYHYYEYPGPHYVRPPLRRRYRPLQTRPLLRR